MSQGLRLIRKEIRRVDVRYTRKDETELLFQLRSLQHKNIVVLLTSYSHDNITNLLFSPADMDLDKFLVLQYRNAGFEEDRSISRAIHGLACGLRHLHWFERKSARATEASTLLYGTHQDIKPKNILVRGIDFILADFGLSRLKPIEEGSQTTWKDATFEYGAPECRDQSTFIQNQIGRPSDIWSLSCIISELMVYMHNGSEGVQRFRNGRLTKGIYGKTRAFHDGTRLKQQVLDALAEVGREANSPATSALFVLLEEMFAERPTDRPDAKRVESHLECIVMKALTQDLLDSIAKLYSGTSVFRTRLRLEENRIRAWAEVLGLLPGQSINSTSCLFCRAL